MDMPALTVKVTVPDKGALVEYTFIPGGDCDISGLPWDIRRLAATQLRFIARVMESHA